MSELGESGPKPADPPAVKAEQGFRELNSPKQWASIYVNIMSAALIAIAAVVIGFIVQIAAGNPLDATGWGLFAAIPSAFALLVLLFTQKTNMPNALFALIVVVAAGGGLISAIIMFAYIGKSLTG